jgi:hypothetical protein
MKKPIAKLKLRVDTIRTLTAKEQLVVVRGAAADPVSTDPTTCQTIHPL